MYGLKTIDFFNCEGFDNLTKNHKLLGLGEAGAYSN
jgi:hypothetical protein